MKDTRIIRGNRYTNCKKIVGRLWYGTADIGTIMFFNANICIGSIHCGYEFFPSIEYRGYFNAGQAF